MGDLIRYDAMCTAIAEAHRVDEVKDIRDKALAMEMYARQALNMDAEHQAKDIRLRAEKKAGDMLKERDRPIRNQHSATSHDVTLQTLDDMGISRNQSARWQALADVPDDAFEAELTQPETASTTGIIQRHRETKSNGGDGKMHPFALWIWGRLSDFEKKSEGNDPEAMLGEMTETMRRDVCRQVPLVIDYLSRLGATDDDS